MAVIENQKNIKQGSTINNSDPLKIMKRPLPEINNSTCRIPTIIIAYQVGASCLF